VCGGGGGGSGGDDGVGGVGGGQSGGGVGGGNGSGGDGCAGDSGGATSKVRVRGGPASCSGSSGMAPRLTTRSVLPRTRPCASRTGTTSAVHAATALQKNAAYPCHTGWNGAARYGGQ
jgi:hypothetical protein